MTFVVLSLGATVALLCTMAFFMMGSLPLLILKHDTPRDARFIRGLFALYYAAVMVVGAALGCLAVVLGLAVSYHADTAASATVAGIAVAQFFVALAVRELAAAIRRPAVESP